MELKKPYMDMRIRGHIEKRDFLFLSGTDVLRFLQGMLSADVKLASTQIPSCTKSFLLDLKAKPVAPISLLCRSAEDFVLSVPAGDGKRVYEALDKYLVADDVTMDLIESDDPKSAFQVCIVFSATDEALRVEPKISKDKSKVFQAREEPNYWNLAFESFGRGHRELWFPKNVSEEFKIDEMNSEEIVEQYVASGLPRWGVDYNEDSFVLEFPFEESISFYKGCYIGQEVVARGSFRGQVAKAFARFTAEKALQAGFVYRENEFEKPVGKITSVSGCRALGQIRLRDYETQKYVIRVESGEIIPILKIEPLNTRISE